jgi:hypothetical protein
MNYTLIFSEKNINTLIVESLLFSTGKGRSVYEKRGTVRYKVSAGAGVFNCTSAWESA